MLPNVFLYAISVCAALSFSHFFPAALVAHLRAAPLTGTARGGVLLPLPAASGGGVLSTGGVPSPTGGVPSPTGGGVPSRAGGGVPFPEPPPSLSESSGVGGERGATCSARGGSPSGSGTSSTLAAAALADKGSSEALGAPGAPPFASLAAAAAGTPPPLTATLTSSSSASNSSSAASASLSASAAAAVGFLPPSTAPGRLLLLPAPAPAPALPALHCCPSTTLPSLTSLTHSSPASLTCPLLCMIWHTPPHLVRAAWDTPMTSNSARCRAALRSAPATASLLRVASASLM